MRLFGRAEAGEGYDLGITDRGDRRDARADRLAVEVHRAGATLCETAAKMRIVQSRLVAKGIEQGHVGLDIDLLVFAVDVKDEFLRHGCLFLSSASSDVLRLHASWVLPWRSSRQKNRSEAVVVVFSDHE